MLKVKDVLGWSSNVWTEEHGFKLVDTIDESDVVVLNGGEDIATEIYGQEPAGSGIPHLKSRRDVMEIECYNEAVRQGKFVFGICRGAQLVNCLNGGTLWQHVNNHGSGHTIYDVFTGRTYHSTSLHHQSMRPPKGAVVIATANRSTIKVSDEGEVKFTPFDTPQADGEDVEILWFPETRSLGVQGHPEYAPGSAFTEYNYELIRQLWAHGVWPSQEVASSAAG